MKKFAAALGLAIVAVLIGTVFVWYLWNWLCPELFKLPSITLVQAIGLTALCRVLFAGK